MHSSRSLKVPIAGLGLSIVGNDPRGVLPERRPPPVELGEFGVDLRGIGVFETTLGRLGVLHRFGAVGKHGSIALIEGFWLTLKIALRRIPFMKPLLWEDLDQALHYSLIHYAVDRPHQALDGATPLEVYTARRPAHRAAMHPPRGKLGQFLGRPPFRIAHLDPERRFPILVKAA
jgi:hypothetical protein